MLRQLSQKGMSVVMGLAPKREEIQRLTRLASLLVVALVACPQAAGSGPRRVSVPAAPEAELPSGAAARTLLTVRGPIVLFAQDGDHIAWSGGCGVVVRNLRTRAKLREKGSSACPEFGRTRRLALGGARALWTTIGCGTSCYTDVYTRAVGERRAVGLVCCDSDGGFAQDRGGGGTGVSAVAGDGSTLAYAVLSNRWHPGGCESEGGRPCELLLSGGGIQRVMGQSKANRLDIPASAMAANGHHLAIAPKAAKGCACNGDPSWSADGRLIAFSSLREGPDSEIVAVSPRGGLPTKVTKNFTYDAEPDWSPDGRALVYATVDSIRIVGADGKGERRVVGDCALDCGSPAWSPDGSRISFAKYGERTGYVIHVARSDGSAVTALTQPGRGEYDGAPAWSPDGETIAFARSAYDDLGNPLFREVWLVDSDGSNQRRLTDGTSPTWIQGKIAFERFDGNDSEIHVVNSDGTSAHQLTDNLVDDYSPDWSPDGARLAFVRKVRNEEELFLMNSDGSGQLPLTDTRPVLTRFPIEVRHAADASLVSSFMPRGKPLAIALSPEFVAVLTQQGRRKRIELFDPTTGARRGAVTVPRAMQARLSIDGGTVVYRVGRTIRLLAAARRKKSVLVTAKSAPVGLSIEGRRVAWAESGKKRSRIRAVWLRARL